MQKKVAIVDRDGLISDLFEALLDGSDVEVVPCKNLDELVQKTDAEDFVLLIVDYDFLTQETIEELKKQKEKSELQVILFSVYSPNDNNNDVIDHCFVKPDQYKQVAELIKVILHT